MTNITWLRNLLRYFGQFLTGTYNYYKDPVTGEFVEGPLFTFFSFIEDNPVVFIFVVAVPLVGLGIGLLNRLIKAN